VSSCVSSPSPPAAPSVSSLTVLNSLRSLPSASGPSSSCVSSTTCVSSRSSPSRGSSRAPTDAPSPAAAAEPGLGLGLCRNASSLDEADEVEVDEVALAELESVADGVGAVTSVGGAADALRFLLAALTESGLVPGGGAPKSVSCLAPPVATSLPFLLEVDPVDAVDALPLPLAARIVFYISSRHGERGERRKEDAPLGAGASLPSTRWKKLSVRPRSLALPAFLSANGLAAGAGAGLGAAGRLAKGLSAAGGADRQLRKTKGGGVRASEKGRTLLWRRRSGLLLELLVVELLRLVAVEPHPLRARHRLILAAEHHLLVLVVLLLAVELHLGAVAPRHADARAVRKALALLRRRRRGRAERPGRARRRRARARRPERPALRRAERRRARRRSRREKVGSGGRRHAARVRPCTGGGRGGAGGRDVTVVDEVGPLALALEGGLLRVGGVVAHLLDELDALLERRQVEEAGDLARGDERRRLRQEEDGVERGLELVGLAERLDREQEVLVGLHLLARERRLERVVVGGRAVLAVLDEERLAQVLLGELAGRDVHVEERELEVELLQ